MGSKQPPHLYIHKEPREGLPTGQRGRGGEEPPKVEGRKGREEEGRKVRGRRRSLPVTEPEAKGGGVVPSEEEWC